MGLVPIGDLGSVAVTLRGMLPLSSRGARKA